MEDTINKVTKPTLESNSYLKSILNPWKHSSVIPDLDMTSSILKTVHCSKTLEVGVTGGGLFIYTPNSHHQGILFYAQDSLGVYHFHSVIEFDEDLSDNFVWGRFVSGGFSVTSNTRSGGTIDIAGMWNSVAYQELPPINELRFETLSSFARAEHEVELSVPITDGITVLAIPDGNFEYHPFNNNYIDTTKDRLIIRKSSKEGWNPVLVSNTTITLNAGVDFPDNLFGNIELAFSLFVTGTSGAQVILQITVFHEEIDPLDWNTVNLVGDNFENLGIANSHQVNSYNFTVPAPIVQITLHLAVSGQSFTNSTTNIVELRTYKFYDKGFFGPGHLIAFQGITPDAKISLSAVDNREVVPDSNLARQITTGTSHAPENPMEIEMAEYLINNIQDFGIKFTNKYSTYEYITNSPGFMNKLTDNLVIAQSSGLPDWLRKLISLGTPIIKQVGDFMHPLIGTSLQQGMKYLTGETTGVFKGSKRKLIRGLSSGKEIKNKLIVKPQKFRHQKKEKVKRKYNLKKQEIPMQETVQPETPKEDITTNIEDIEDVPLRLSRHHTGSCSGLSKWVTLGHSHNLKLTVDKPKKLIAKKRFFRKYSIPDHQIGRTVSGRCSRIMSEEYSRYVESIIPTDGLPEELPFNDYKDISEWWANSEPWEKDQLPILSTLRKRVGFLPYEDVLVGARFPIIMPDGNGTTGCVVVSTSKPFGSIGIPYEITTPEGTRVSGVFFSEAALTEDWTLSVLHSLESLAGGNTTFYIGVSVPPEIEVLAGQSAGLAALVSATKTLSRALITGAVWHKSYLLCPGEIDHKAKFAQSINSMLIYPYDTEPIALGGSGDLNNLVPMADPVGTSIGIISLNEIVPIALPCISLGAVILVCGYTYELSGIRTIPKLKVEQSVKMNVKGAPIVEYYMAPVVGEEETISDSTGTIKKTPKEIRDLFQKKEQELKAYWTATGQTWTIEKVNHYMTQKKWKLLLNLYKSFLDWSSRHGSKPLQDPFFSAQLGRRIPKEELESLDSDHMARILKWNESSKKAYNDAIANQRWLKAVNMATQYLMACRARGIVPVKKGRVKKVGRIEGKRYVPKKEVPPSPPEVHQPEPVVENVPYGGVQPDDLLFALELWANGDNTDAVMNTITEAYLSGHDYGFDFEPQYNEVVDYQNAQQTVLTSEQPKTYSKLFESEKPYSKEEIQALEQAMQEEE